MYRFFFAWFVAYLLPLAESSVLSAHALRTRQQPTAVQSLPNQFVWWDNVTVSDMIFVCERPVSAPDFDFNFENPNAKPFEKVYNALCKKSWKWDGQMIENGPPNGLDIGKHTVCWSKGYRTFQFAFLAFQSPGNFSLTLNTRYWDPSLKHGGSLYQNIYSDVALALEPYAGNSANYTLWYGKGLTSSMVNGATA